MVDPRCFALQSRGEGGHVTSCKCGSQSPPDEVVRLRLIEAMTIGMTTSEVRALAAAAIEVYEGHRRNLPPGPWSEVKMRLIDAAIAFGKATER